MRVIAGTARRLQLKTLDGMDTRPTTDRIKETLFNMISAELYDSNFLDLFSGSGGIGIEALSRRLNPLRKAHGKRVLRVFHTVARLKALRQHSKSSVLSGHGHDRLNCCCDTLLIQRSDLKPVASDQPFRPSD